VTATALRRAAAGGDPDQEIPGVPPRDPNSRFPTESGNRVTARFPIPIPGRIGNRLGRLGIYGSTGSITVKGVLNPQICFPLAKESGIGSSLPVSRPNRESGERDSELGISGSAGTSREPMLAGPAGPIMRAH
jgi:hypothetical protein